MIKSTSIRFVIMELLKNKFAGFAFWERVEPEVVMMVGDLVEPINDEKKREFLKQLVNLKEFFLENDILESELTFLDDEIESHKGTKTISLYEEEEDEVDALTIERYAKLSASTEGVIGIHQPYNFTQLSKLTNGVYRKTGFIKFYISREKTVYGKIVAEIYEQAQKIPIASLIQSKKIDKETGEPEANCIVLFGEHYSGKQHVSVRQIPIPFFIYKMITENNQEMILLSLKQCDIGDYMVTGCITECDDKKMLTDSAKLPTKLPFMFAQEVRNRIIKFKDHKEFGSRIKYLGISDKNFFEFPFSIMKGSNTYKMIHPKWYKWLIWSWLVHEPKGIFNTYPVHLLIVGPKHSGKSLLLNGLHARSKETRSVFSGSSSTLKHLVPSFKYNPARIGYLAESNRFAFCDEFLRCLINTRTTREGSAREESVAIMNDLLEHQKRQVGSGVSSVNVNMTARILATTNPVRDIHSVEKLITTFDESFLSRWLVLFQTEDHVKLIRKSKDADLETLNFKMQINDWVSILDYLHSFSATYDSDKMDEVYLSIPKVLSETLNKHYDARHRHHIECLLDGIVKTRCLLSGDMSFVAKKEDYDILKQVWMAIIRSWINPEYIKKLDVKDRIFYLPEACQGLYWKINALKRPVGFTELRELSLELMTKDEYLDTISILVDNGVLMDNDGFIKPHYMSEVKHAKQRRLRSGAVDEEVV